MAQTLSSRFPCFVACARYLNDLVAAVPDLHIKLPKKRDMVVAEAEGAPEVDTDLLSKCVAPPLSPHPAPRVVQDLRWQQWLPPGGWGGGGGGACPSF